MFKNSSGYKQQQRYQHERVTGVYWTPPPFIQTGFEFQWSTLTMSSRLYQPTSILFLVASSSVVTRSRKATNFSCEVWEVAVRMGSTSWSSTALFGELHCGKRNLVKTSDFFFVPKPGSLSKPTFSRSKAMDKWSLVNHCWWSHSGTPSFPLARFWHMRRSFAFKAFLCLSSWVFTNDHRSANIEKSHTPYEKMV